MTLSSLKPRVNFDFPEERADLAAAFRWTARLGMNEAVANHFSLAVSEDGKRFLINPNQRHFARIKASDLLLLDADDPDVLKRPDAPDHLDLPAGFLDHLAVQGGNRLLSGIDAAAGQLELGYRGLLKGCQDAVAPQQNRIDPRPAPIALARLHRLSIASDHGPPLVLWLPCLYSCGMPRLTPQGNPNAWTTTRLGRYRPAVSA